VLISTLLINHFDFVELQQVWAHWRNMRYEHPGFHGPLVQSRAPPALFSGFYWRFGPRL
jgi:hypothetical protein